MEHFWIEAIGYCGTALTIAGYAMRTIIPLRVASILGSVFFIGYGLMIQSVPVVVTELILLPLNVWRLWQILRVLEKVRHPTLARLTAGWLKPLGDTRRYKPGEVVFATGEVADFLLHIESGSFRLVEANIRLGDGEVVGEMGFLSPGNLRTMTLVCDEAGSATRVSYAQLKQLYFTNPEFAFYFLRLISGRLFENLDRAKRAQATG